jgi:hypothetical protein
MIFCWLEFSTGYYLQAKRSNQGLFENETPRSCLQYFNNSAFDSVITELKSKPTRSLFERASAALMCSRTTSAIALGKKFGPPLHRKATIRNSSHYNRTDIFICNARANPCAPYSIPLNLQHCTRRRPARRFKLLDLHKKNWQLANYEC